MLQVDVAVTVMENEAAAIGQRDNAASQARAALLQALSDAKEAFLHHGRDNYSLDTFQWYLLPAARKLAEALQAYWQLPEQQAAARLEVARAAAARSCAYLRCSNLAAEGGVSAGEGKGSLRCSGCRVVWWVPAGFALPECSHADSLRRCARRYCGTACSHADWCEGGHRKVCKALAAERQAQRQAAQQQAA